MVELQLAVHLPEPVQPDSRLVNIERMALRMSLRPIANVMHVNDASWAPHPNQHAQVDETEFQPLRTFKAAVDQ